MGADICSTRYPDQVLYAARVVHTTLTHTKSLLSTRKPRTWAMATASRLKVLTVMFLIYIHHHNYVTEKKKIDPFIENCIYRTF